LVVVAVVPLIAEVVEVMTATVVDLADTNS